MSSPVSSTASTRSASPSKANPMSAPAATTAAWSDAGEVDPHSALMLRPSGWACRTSTTAPRSRTTEGATVDAAPLAQSSTTCSPSRRRPSTEARTAWA